MLSGQNVKPRKTWKTISIILAAIWMTMIFVMSALPAETSDQQSGAIVDLVKNIFNVTPAQPELFDNLTTIVRKCAHGFEYFVLGILLLNLFWQFWPKRWYLALVFTILYAVTDEIHQAFVPDRSCELRDIIIDSVAAGIGIGMAMLIRKLIRRQHRRRNLT